MRNPNNTPSPLSQKLLLYGLGAGAASLAATAYAGPTDVIPVPVGLQGKNIYFNLQNTVSASTSSGTGQQFELSLSYSSFKNSPVNGGNVKGLAANGEVIAQSRMGGPFGSINRSYALELSAGTTIGAGSNFASNGILNTVYYYNTGGQETIRGNKGDWKTANRGFLGLEIMVNGQIDYGFADVTLNSYSRNTGSFVLNGFAYDPTGAPITTFQIPEPGSTTALLVAGAAGVAALRRRQEPAQPAHA